MNKNIKKWILFTQHVAGMELPVKQENSGINMSYNFIFHYIGYDATRIESAIKKEVHGISLDDYVKTFSLHELGHALDRESLLASLDRTIEIYELKSQYSGEERYKDRQLLSALIEEHKMNIEFEKTAWKNAQKINSAYDIVGWKTFEILKNLSLQTYVDSYQKHLLAYEKLVEQTEKIA
ncbi:integrase [Siminovitchia sediminis]|uniref:Integrase n=1 Tax=Siminovitchia sediminis TaxID=1274353 RepID=A0ABW4KAS3_9BACI